MNNILPMLIGQFPFKGDMLGRIEDKTQTRGRYLALRKLKED